MDLGFLSNMEVAAPEMPAKRSQGGTPINGAMRIRKAGKVEFSDDFRTLVNEKWLDLFFSHNWLQYDKANPNILFLCINDEEKPAKADVKSEGTSVYVKEYLWAEAAEVFGFDPELSFVDLVLEDAELPVPIALLPKRIQRGEEKGNMTYTKRENITLKVLSIAPEFLPGTGDEEVPVEKEGDMHADIEEQEQSGTDMSTSPLSDEE